MNILINNTLILSALFLSRALVFGTVVHADEAGMERLASKSNNYG